jgi:hypothetical protein
MATKAAFDTSRMCLVVPGVHSALLEAMRTVSCSDHSPLPRCLAMHSAIFLGSLAMSCVLALTPCSGPCPGIPDYAGSGEGCQGPINSAITGYTPDIIPVASKNPPDLIPYTTGTKPTCHRLDRAEGVPFCHRATRVADRFACRLSGRHGLPGFRLHGSHMRFSCTAVHREVRRPWCTAMMRAANHACGSEIPCPSRRSPTTCASGASGFVFRLETFVAGAHSPGG